ncbi:MAG: hypothetical protein AAGI71_00360 [Bacteroidota bacterium]
MNTSTPDSSAEQALFSSMALFASLAAAARLWQQARDRQADRDPTTQEPTALARSWLAQALLDLERHLMRLRLSRAQAETVRAAEESRLVTVVRRYDDLMVLQQALHLLQGVHQRLLSLYPAVEEQVVEEARIAYTEGQALLESETFPLGAEAWVEATMRLVQHLRHE